ncbi:Rad4-domain-containing protein [Meredithblackwellia eburnea MCA 4105]
MSTLSLHSSRASSSQPGWGNSSGMSESDDERYDSRRGAFFSGDGNDEDSDDDEDAWDEVDVDQDNRISTLSSAAAAAAAAGSEAIEIVIQKGGKQKATKKKPNGSTTRERMVRQERHKVHAICHLAVGLIRNRWLNNPLLKSRQARLVSVVPLNLQRNFTSFNKTTHPNERDRSRMFDHALNELLSWWYQWFDIKWGKEIRRRTVPDVERELEEWGWDTSTSNVPWEGLDAAGEEEDEEVRGAGDVDDSVKKGRSAKSMGKGKGKGKGKAKAKEPPWISSSISSGEPINSVQSLMKHVVNHNGSRDMSAQLFTCACRALDIPARLIFSLQPADWKAPSASAKSWKKKRGDSGKQSEGEAVSTDDGRRGKNSRSARKGDGKMKTNGSGQNKNLKDKVLNLRRGSSSKVSDADSGDDEWVDGRGQLNYTLPPVNLRRSKPARRDPNRSSSPDPKAMSSPPVFWTEVYSRSNRHWISVDPTRKKMRCRGIMEPPRSCVENQLLYVVAFEEDGSARDVTPRYAKSFNTITMKARVPSKKGTDWFADLLKPHARSFQLNRDKDEEEELWNRKVNEPMPTSVAAFKNHPTYVLEQHLHRDETILPGSKKLGVFRGTEIVYARSAVVQLKSEENWRRVGRVVKSDIEIPMKWVKQRTVTINRKRAENLALMDGGEVTQQPLYAESQTKIYIPPPVVNGKIPKNDFGNIDLYVPSMLPEGATHLPHKSAAKCAKTLGIDYAEAVTGFEFRQRRANPIISGVVVAEEFADLLIEAIINTQTAADEKEFLKRQDRVLKRWKKLIIGLRIRQRIQASYHQQPVKAASLAEESQVCLLVLLQTSFNY